MKIFKVLVTAPEIIWHTTAVEVQANCADDAEYGVKGTIVDFGSNLEWIEVDALNGGGVDPLDSKATFSAAEIIDKSGSLNDQK